MSSKGKPKNCYCYYCNKGFDEERQLIAHQKVIHFRCPICKSVKDGSKALVTHISHAHGQLIQKIPNAMPGREDPSIDIYGMRGVPEEAYVAWIADVNPEFKERAKGINFDGAYIATDATRMAQMTHMSTTSRITYNTLNQFQKANVSVNPTLNTVITAQGVTSTDEIQKGQKYRGENIQTIQRKYDSMMYQAKKLIEDAEQLALKTKKKELKERRKHEVLFCQIQGDLSPIESRLAQLGYPTTD